MTLRSIFIYMAVAVIFVSCKKTEKDNADVGREKLYFSVIEFTKDQWDTHFGQPYSLEKVVVMNGKADTTYVSAVNMDWVSIFKTFFESDISDKKYLDRYNFSLFRDDATLTRTFYYEAKEKDLFTRTLQVTAEQDNNKIRSIYIETEKNGTMSDLKQRLYYSPLKVIQIQEFEKSKTGPDKDMMIIYRFQ